MIKQIVTQEFREATEIDVHPSPMLIEAATALSMLPVEGAL
jgi:hypothetical protein